MSDATEVIAAAEARAAALADGDGERLAALLHRDFRWTTHTGLVLDRDDYVRRNTSGTTVWHSQRLHDVHVATHGDAAVLTCRVLDRVAGRDGDEVFEMPMTQVWVRSVTGWVCLAGHAGPRILPGTAGYRVTPTHTGGTTS